LCFFFLVLLNIVVMSTVSVHVYMNMKQCLHSKENVYRESVIVNGNINKIDFNIISGIVNIRFHNSSNILVKVWDNARSRSYVDQNTFDSGVTLKDSTISIHSITPAFDLKSCIHAKVEVFIPFNHPQQISLTGIVKAGMVHIQGKKGKLGKVDITVEMGRVDIENIEAQSLSVLTDLGSISVDVAIISQNVRLQAHTGGIKTFGIISNTFHSLAQFGYTLHYHLKALNSVVNTKFGFSKVVRSSIDISVPENVHSNTINENELSMKTEYGRSILHLKSQNVDFQLLNTKGHMLVEYEDEFTCTLANNTSLTQMIGKCTPKIEHFIKSTTKVVIETKYGESNLVVEREFEVQDD